MIKITIIFYLFLFITNYIIQQLLSALCEFAEANFEISLNRSELDKIVKIEPI